MLRSLAILALLLTSAFAPAQQTTSTSTAPTPSTELATTETKALQIKDRLLTGSTSRARLTTTTVDVIMLHFCSDVIANPDNPYQVTRIVDIFTSYGVSAHYLIDREGLVHRFVPEERVAHHAGKGHLDWMPDRHNNMNEYSIGIEMLNIGSWRDMKTFMKKEKYDAFAAKHPNLIGYTDAQYTALNQLLADIRSRHPVPLDRRHIVGHEDYAGTARRTDPGDLFDWSRIGLSKEPGK